ncbi:TetR/AcrR family transcriptional regulator [Lentilactobacillus sunkii]|uniref:HTH tetR-type domain-containing protein n=1 Tax=Lentilactobacillus sunkii DSM 19904 TaxID=1423808 RepID=A0A0R1L9D0_9LACO|nr:TetR/AcrR family transcriptional regulator [Lentilactobacillus sunkii]KRK89585.1 hypothetical protein FD17_GL001174 [Lentilactobacillus sunkii DSM 19904]
MKKTKDNQNLRVEILSATENLFIQHGYSAVTYSQIAKEVGISKSLLQYYFPKKSLLLEQIMYANFNQWIASIPVEETYAKLATFLMMFFKFISQNPQIHKFIIEIIENNELFDIFINYFQKWLTKHDLLTGNQSKIRSALLFALSGGLQLYRFKDNLKLPINRITSTIMTSFLSMLDVPASLIKNTLTIATDTFDQLSSTTWEFTTDFKQAD